MPAAELTAFAALTAAYAAKAGTPIVNVMVSRDWDPAYALPFLQHDAITAVVLYCFE